MIPISFRAQILPGTFEYTLNYLIDHELDLSVFIDTVRNTDSAMERTRKFDPNITTTSHPLRIPSPFKNQAVVELRRQGVSTGSLGIMRRQRIQVVALLSALVPLGAHGSGQESAGAAGATSEHRAVGLRYAEASTREFLIAVLDSMDLPYTVEQQPGSVTVYWRPTAPGQEVEVQRRVSQFTFVRDVCKGIPMPGPNKPAQEHLECEQ